MRVQQKGLVVHDAFRWEGLDRAGWMVLDVFLPRARTGEVTSGSNSTTRPRSVSIMIQPAHCTLPVPDGSKHKKDKHELLYL